jgi:hypothetical protein
LGCTPAQSPNDRIDLVGFQDGSSLVHVAIIYNDRLCT